MEKKNRIVVKLFEEFKNDREYSKTRTKEILEFISKTGIKDNMSGQFSVNISTGDPNEHNRVADVEIEMSSNLDGIDYNEGIHFKVPFSIEGGELIHHEDRLSPAEYSDEETIFEEYEELRYFKYWDDQVKQLEDIDYIEVPHGDSFQSLMEDIVSNDI